MTTTAALTPEEVAESALIATANLPAYDASDRFRSMLEHLIDTGQDKSDDDTQSAIIAACRRKAGLA